MVSAIITTHKRSPEIVERALQSVLNQTWRDLEVIVVDDSPADFEQRDAVGETVHRLSAASGRPVQYIHAGARVSPGILAWRAHGENSLLFWMMMTNGCPGRLSGRWRR